MSIFACSRTGAFACSFAVALGLQPASSYGVGSEPRKFVRVVAVINQALAVNPEMQAAEAAVDAVRAQLAGAGLPLNNPELQLGGERTDTDSYSVGISQTLDWYGKQGAYQQEAQARVEAAQASLQALKLAKTTEMLDAIGRVTTQRRINELAEQRSATLARFSQIARKRQQAGDIPCAELELARLSRAQAVMQQAQSAAELIQSDSDFFTLSGRVFPSDLDLPVAFEFGPMVSTDDDSVVRNHPAVRAALGLAQVARQQIRTADKARKADPTLGLAVGRDNKEDLVGISFSMPLQFRNNFSSAVDSARASALQAEQEAQQAFQTALARLQAARSRYQLIADAWSMWSSQGQGSLRRSVALLERQSRAGEMSTTDYLLQVKQSLDTRIAATELQGERWSAWVEWLSASTSLEDWLFGTVKEQ